MGTPNSDFASNALIDYLVRGTAISIDRIVALDIDRRLLEDRFAALKSQLPYIEGYEPIESVQFNGPWRNKFWKDEVEEAGLTGTRVLFFNQDHGQSIFSLHPVGSGTYNDADVFLKRDGSWIVATKSGVQTKGATFACPKNVSEVINVLESLQGNSHELRSTGYRALEYWPRESRRTNRGHHEASPIALVMMAHLGILLDRSITAKEERLVNQQRLRARFTEVDSRNHLNMQLR